MSSSGLSENDDAVLESIKSVVGTHADVPAGDYVCASLADNNCARLSAFATVNLNPKVFWI